MSETHQGVASMTAQQPLSDFGADKGQTGAGAKAMTEAETRKQTSSTEDEQQEVQVEIIGLETLESQSCSIQMRRGNLKGHSGRSSKRR